MIEHNPITGDPVIVEPERAHRPNIYRQPDHECPFCPGNESMTPPETLRIGDPWQVRAFPNKYPAADWHEVVVESPDHDATFDAIGHAARAVDVLIDRYRFLVQEAAHVMIFKNHGAYAGATIPHLHSQILGTPFVPPRVEREAAAFAERCALCVSHEPLIRETENYRWIAPRGSMFAWEQWIAPRKHTNEITEPREIAGLLQASVAAMRGLTPAFNWIFMNFPRTPHAHAYVQLFPRFAVHAGFELGSGSSINAVPADETVQRFR